MSFIYIFTANVQLAKNMEKPTPRAVQQRIFVIRQNARNSGTLQPTQRGAVSNGGIRKRRAATTTPLKPSRMFDPDDEYVSYYLFFSPLRT